VLSSPRCPRTTSATAPTAPRRAASASAREDARPIGRSSRNGGVPTRGEAHSGASATSERPILGAAMLREGQREPLRPRPRRAGRSDPSGCLSASGPWSARPPRHATSVRGCRFDRTSADGVDPDSAGLKFASHASRQRAHGRLARRIGTGHGEPSHSGDRGGGGIALDHLHLGAEFPAGSIHGLLRAGGDDDFRALRDEQLGGRQTDTARSSGDDHLLAGKPCHPPSSFTSIFSFCAHRPTG
jgi:hypothetical protein